MVQLHFKSQKQCMYVPVVTLKTRQSIELKTLLSKTFKRSVIWNEYKSKIQTVTAGVGAANNDIKIILLDSSNQGMSRLTVAGYPNNGQVRFGDPAVQPDTYKKCFTPTEEIKDYNLLIDDRNIYDQNISDSITRYNELLKQTTGRSKDYTTGSLISYDYYLKYFDKVVLNASQQPLLYSDPKAIQQIEF